ncbi:KTSC domain-containing protein [Verminephrobacter eiseniae]|uniref:KTSC domain-containing protein n=1 Tax=Verminephrobacter eiseniae TaxID=364317 RepID=UPI002238A680|nr:KTSC domain-containing protein [Verminephrobacter eiseniae]MCW5234342.1 KTSC domain-containing protein [Verminephrobacter eiseniae]MCW5294100.1 KTSC domain-containing protein [Verminephrobacter eiseniae]MCW8183161.1 KTSC domain-containing protein [Verminephrobacter eiseniae]MCW8222102.1 KTSC domain-containing protein [Verminephrobacter eiseniae]MCW8232696.1 KTSC domain-containing protein [Verminephrobacter eiseniae]
MDWISTPDSSNITQFAYDRERQVLTVEFHGGRVYNYFDVPESVFEEMQNAPSKGKYLAYQIKGSYRYARV